MRMKSKTQIIEEMDRLVKIQTDYIIKKEYARASDLGARIGGLSWVLNNHRILNALITKSWIGKV